MGEAKRRKQLDPNFGRSKKQVQAKKQEYEYVLMRFDTDKIRFLAGESGGIWLWTDNPHRAAKRSFQKIKDLAKTTDSETNFEISIGHYWKNPPGVEPVLDINHHRHSNLLDKDSE